MVEPLFGTGSSVWTGIPAPAFGWFPTSPTFNARSTGAMSGIPAAPQATIGNSPAPEAYVHALPLNAFTFAGAPIVTAPALLGAVAMKRGQPAGPTNDQEIEDFLYDALELMTGTNDVEVRCEGGRATLTGSVQHKRLKRDIGEIAWAIPTINDVQNNVSIATRRRARSSAREGEPNTPSRKQV
jgi:hypothetical protein